MTHAARGARVVRRLGILLASIAIALVGCGDREAGAPAAAATEPAAAVPAPEFSLNDLQGNTVTLSALRGRVVVIDFWATWCPPCEFQIPVLSALADAHRGEPVDVIGISVDTDGPEVVRAYAEEHGVRYTILLGSEALARDFGAPGFPALIVVSPDGKIHSRHVGLIEQAELESIVARARSEARPG